MPVECHAHMLMNGIDYYAAARDHENGPVDAIIRRQFEAYVKYGITFIRDGGDAAGVTSRAKELACEYGIDYRTPVFAIHRNGCYGSIVGKGFDDMAGYTSLVDEAARRGADFIKIMTTGIMDFKQFGRITSTPLPAREVAEMAHIAHEMGFAVMAHVNGKQQVLEALEAGIDSIEHGNYIDDECLDAFVDTGAIYVPTATVAYNLIGSGHGDDEVLTRIWEASRNVIAQAFDKGVTLAVGSDAGAVGVPHGQGALDEYARFVDAIGEQTELEKRLEEGAKQVKERFRRQ